MFFTSYAIAVVRPIERSSNSSLGNRFVQITCNVDGYFWCTFKWIFLNNWLTRSPWSLLIFNSFFVIDPIYHLLHRWFWSAYIFNGDLKEIWIPLSTCGDHLEKRIRNHEIRNKSQTKRINSCRMARNNAWSD